MAALTLRSVYKSYQSVDVLKNIDIEVKSGEFLVLLGPSGCGKSTLLHSLAGLTSITSGDIVIDGKRVNDVPCHDRDIAMVFQSYALYPSMSVRANIGFPLEMRKVPAAQRAKAVDDVASLLKITHLLDRKPGQLSGGQRQRVAIGRALVRNPRLFLFDEPLSNLDALLRVEMRTELKKLHQRIGKTTVYVTHDQVEAMTLASRIAILNNGALQKLGTPNEVYERPANLFVATFIGSPSMNLLPVVVSSRGGELVVLLASKSDKAVEIRVSESVVAGLPRDTELTMGIRPEWLSMEHTFVPHTALLDATITLIEPTGPDEFAVFAMAGHEITGRFAVGELPREGAVRLAFDSRKALFFDTRSGSLLGRHA
jgi:multiple sugar transport system ATP-binding protein